MRRGVPPTNDPLFGRLTESVDSGDCIAFIGAGMSAPDYPIWRDLIAMLRDRCGLRPENLASLEPLDIAEAARSNNPSEYYKLLEEIFCRTTAVKCVPRYHLLARIRFGSYVTLNFDPLLEQILSLHRDIALSQYPWLSSEYHKKGEIFHLHGRLVSNCPVSQSKIVLTRTDFEFAYDHTQTRLDAFVQGTFCDHDVCFLGCDPSEPNLKGVLRTCEGLRQAHYGNGALGKPQWFALLDDGSSMTGEIENTGIRIVRYPKVDEHYAGLGRVLEYWAKKKKPILRSMPAAAHDFDVDSEPQR